MNTANNMSIKSNP